MFKLGTVFLCLGCILFPGISAVEIQQTDLIESLLQQVEDLKSQQSRTNEKLELMDLELISLRKEQEQWKQTAAPTESPSNDNSSKHSRIQKRSYYSNNIAFYATLSNTIDSLGRSQTVRYDHVLTNIGNAYNHVDGVFVVPVTGIYAFSWYLMADRNGHFEELDIVVNGRVFATAYTAQPDYESSSKTVVIELNANDHVWIRTSAANGHGTLYGSHFNSFTGWLLYPSD